VRLRFRIYAIGFRVYSLEPQAVPSGILPPKLLLSAINFMGGRRERFREDGITRRNFYREDVF